MTTLAVGTVLELNERTKALVDLEKHYFFANVKQSDSSKIAREVNFTGKFSFLAGVYIVTSVEIIGGVESYTCQKDDGKHTVILKLNPLKMPFVKPFKVIGRAECKWEIIEKY